MPPASNSIIDAAQNYDVIDIMNRGLAYAIMIAGFLSVVFIFVGGISFILSGGQDDKIKSAVGTIRYAIIGLVVTILSVVIINTVGRAIGINVIQYINFKDVISIITSVGQDSGTSSSSSGPSRLEKISSKI